VADENSVEAPQATGSDAADRSDSEARDRPAPGNESPPGHGRYGADDYPGAKQVDTRSSICLARSLICSAMGH